MYLVYGPDMSWSYEKDPAEEEWTHLSYKYANYIKWQKCVLEMTK